MIIMENHPSNVPKLFQNYHKQYRNLTDERLQPLTEEDIFLLSLYLIHEKVRNMSDSKNEDIVRKYGIPEINEEQRTSAK